MPRLTSACYASGRRPAELDIAVLNTSPGDASIQLSGEVMECAGFTTLADFAAQLRQHGSTLGCTNAQGPVKRLFELLAANPCDASARHPRARAAALRTRLHAAHVGLTPADLARRRPPTGCEPGAPPDPHESPNPGRERGAAWRADAGYAITPLSTSVSTTLDGAGTRRPPTASPGCRLRRQKHRTGTDAHLNRRLRDCSVARRVALRYR